MGKSIYKDKKKGFLFLTISIISTILLINLLINYRIIFRKGERVKEYETKIKIEELTNTLETLAYGELRKIDRLINEGKIVSGAEYIGSNDKSRRVWFGDTENIRSKSGYAIKTIRLNNKNTIYFYKEGEKKKFSEIIGIELIAIGDQLNIIGIEMEKIVYNAKSEEKVYFKARVDLYYESGNKNPLAPYKEVLKDFEVGFK